MLEKTASKLLCRMHTRYVVLEVSLYLVNHSPLLRVLVKMGNGGIRCHQNMAQPSMRTSSSPSRR